RRRVPQLERIGGLDVIVVVEEQRPRAGAAELAPDRGRRAVDTELLGLEARADEELLDEVGRLRQRLSLGRDAGLPAEELEQPDGLQLDRRNVDRRHRRSLRRIEQLLEA